MARCADCGYLALRNLVTGALDEAPHEYRSSGSPLRLYVAEPLLSNKVARGLPLHVHRMAPVCFAQAWDLLAEFPFKNPGLITVDQVLSVTERDRACASFTPWIQGFTPKEHREMVNEAERRQYEAEQRRQADERAERTLARQEKIAKQQFNWSLIVLGVGVIVATIIGSMIQAGWIQNPRGAPQQPIIVTVVTINPSPAP